MDFSLTDEQQAVIDAARKIFEDKTEATELWRALADANLLGLAVAESDGGSGLGFAEVAILLEEAGRAAAPTPLWAAVVLGALPISRFGTDEQRARYLKPIIAGEEIVTAALVEAGAEPASPATTAAPAGSAWELRGTKLCVPAGTVASAVLVSATIAGGETGLFIVDPGAAGVAVTELTPTTGIPEARIDLDGALGERLGGEDALAWLLARATAGLCALMAGTCRAAILLTAEYAKGREQFGRAIATFQAVGQRAADAYIDAEAIELTARQAAWLLAAERPAAEQVAIAKYWASEGGQRVVHAAQHIHGGVGVDRSYPLHRYFLAAKQIELTLGGTTQSLRRLGALMAANA